MTTQASYPEQQIAVVYRNTADLKPDPQNPRLHSRKQIRQIAASIKTFGFITAALIDGNDQVVAGHGRLLACAQLGIQEIPTICIEHLSATQIRAFMIADNKLCENATWDANLLALHFKELSLLNLDFSLDVTGFQLAEIDLHIEGLDTVSKEKVDAADHVPALSSVAVTQVGDLWLLGQHRLHCANSLDAASYIRLTDGQLAAMVFTDFSYNVAINGHAGGKGSIQHREFAMASGEMSQEEFSAFLTTACQRMAHHSRPGSIHMLAMDWRHMTEILAAGKTVYTELKNLCVWVKDTGGMGSMHRSQHELFFIYKHGTATHINNIQLGKFGRNRTNVWKYPGVNSFARVSDEGNLLALHPTVKPVALIADALLDCSHRGDIVLDPFLGSGSTLIAAERVGRLCYGMELEPLYVDTAIRRWQTYTGQQAIHAVTGQTFQEREAHAIQIANLMNQPAVLQSTEVHHVAQTI